MNNLPHSKIPRVLLIGCGAVSRLYYTPALQELERIREVEVTGLCDPNPEATALVGASFPAARRLTSVDEGIQLGVDLAIVASPPRFHAQHSIQALAARLPVLCEKPMATSVTEAEAMVAAAKASGCPLAIGLFRRCFPATQWIHAALHKGMLGEIQTMSCFEGGPFHWPVASVGYFKGQSGGGGVLLDIGVHALDLTMWWFGEPDSVEFEDDAAGGLDVNCRISLRYSRGLTAEIQLSREWRRPNVYQIQGTKGWLRWEANDADHLQIGMPNLPYLVEGGLAIRPADREAALAPAENFQRSFMQQIRNLLQIRQGGNPPMVTGEEGLRSLRWIERCLAVRKLMEMPWLSPEERDRTAALRAAAIAP